MCMLFSYAFVRKDEKLQRVIEELSPYVDILIDSGAFTDYSASYKALANNSTNRAPIVLADYMDYCTGVHGKVWQYIMLDVIGNPAASMTNIDIMVDHGLKPMSVLVVGEDEESVLPYLDTNPFICVAGGAYGSASWAANRVASLFKASGGKARIHALGFTRHPTAFQLPVASIDSSSWCSGGRFGTLSMYNKRMGMKTLGRVDLDGRIPKAFAVMFKRCGITRDVLSNPENHSKTTSIMSSFTILAHLMFQRHVAQENFRYFLAVPNRNWVSTLSAIVSNVVGVDHLDWHGVRGEMDRLKQLELTNPDGYVDAVVEIFKRKTAWDIPLTGSHKGVPAAW